jgi:thiol-disulfide isomerase/thioredoxin
MKKFPVLIAFIILSLVSKAQYVYDIKINLKGAKDTVIYLLKYTWDQTYVVDTCKNPKNGNVEFKGKTELEKGIYILVSQDKVPYFEFIVNESQKLNFSSNTADIVSNLNAGASKENEQFFSYMKYSAQKNKEFNATLEQTKGKSKEDSAKTMSAKITQLNNDVRKHDLEFLEQIKGSFLYDFMYMRQEKVATDIPKAKNGRPDSVYTYYYYKNHYFDGINFKDERILRTPTFDDRIKTYFDNVLLMHPDTIIAEIDKVLAKCEPGSQIFNVLVGYFTYKYETSKIVSFDKVFVHLADNYILNGKTGDYYSEDVKKNIKNRVDILRNLLAGKKVSDLYMIDTLSAPEVRRMGFDTATSSKSITDLYYKNEAKLATLFKTLYPVNAKYTVLLFWAADCGHCQTEVPKLHEQMKEIKGKIDIKVIAFQTKDDLYDSWRKFIIEHKLTDFMHFYDPVHINGIKDKFDVNSTPTVFILDKDKKILVKKVNSDQVIEIIRNFEIQAKQL